MKILITGAAGFIGSNLTEYLLSQEHLVIGLDNFSSGKRSNIQGFKKNYTLMEGDIRDFDLLKRVAQGVDAIIHLAALSSVQKSLQDPKAYFENNVQGFINVLEVVRSLGIKKFIYASSASVYGDDESVIKIEDRIGNALSPYAMTKRLDEEICEHYFKTFGVSSTGLRYFNIFGPRLDMNSEYASVIGRWIKELNSGVTPSIFGDGNTTRDFIYIEDVCAAHKLILEKDAKEGAKIYNVGSGEKTTLKELFNVLKKIFMKFDMNPLMKEERKGDIRFSQASIKKIREDYDFKPRFNLEEGLRKYISTLNLIQPQEPSQLR